MELLPTLSIPLDTSTVLVMVVVVVDAEVVFAVVVVDDDVEVDDDDAELEDLSVVSVVMVVEERSRRLGNWAVHLCKVTGGQRGGGALVVPGVMVVFGAAELVLLLGSASPSPQSIGQHPDHCARIFSRTAVAGYLSRSPVTPWRP